MSQTQYRCHIGDLRPSQLISTFGIGAIVDLPHISAIVMGIDEWRTHQMQEVSEERLRAAVRWKLSSNVQRLLTPPAALDEGAQPPNPFDGVARVGVPVATFPRWLRCPYCDLLAPLSSGLFQLEPSPFHPERTRYLHTNCKKPGKPPIAVPSRFLVACKAGHLDDFPWVYFAHRGECGCEAPVIRLKQTGVAGEASDLYVRCDACQMARSLSDVFDTRKESVLPACRARRPQLRDYDEDGCNESLEAISLGASNGWFPLLLTALSIPETSDPLDQLVVEQWSILAKATSQDVLAAFRAIGQLAMFASWSDDDLWAAIQARRAADAGDEADEEAEKVNLKHPEWAAFSSPGSAPQSSDFKLTPTSPPGDYASTLSEVVLVERLREVRAFLGFTRLEAPGAFDEPSKVPPEHWGRLSSREPEWVPAVEIRGEGIFIRFDHETLRKWSAQVEPKNKEFFTAHRQWRIQRKIDDPSAGYPGISYILLHTFSHALMRQLALECGYAAASIRERIYCSAPDEQGEPMSGVLLYTAAPDSEGTLGGLVRLGAAEILGRHLTQMLEQTRLCASDPLCAEHHPLRDGVSLHGAACHACLFAPETSCERGNRYLDRSLLVKTFGSKINSFFDSSDG